MNDLMDVRDALGQPEPPSQAAYTAARTALLARAATTRAPGLTVVRPPRRQARTAVPGWLRQRRTGWLAGGFGVTAAAAAVAVAVATGSTGAPGLAGGHPGHARDVSQLSARQILLLAATTAASRPAASGKYWYVKQADTGPASTGTARRRDVLQDWYGHDGSDYHLSPYRHVVYWAGGGGFSVGGSLLTYQQIQHLPSTAAALKAWIIRSFYHPTAPPPASRAPVAAAQPPPRAEIPGDVAVSLGQLLGQEPAPPALRAAAFRALAALPDVTKIGRVPGGVVLRVTFPKPPANKWPGGRRPPGTGQIQLTITTSTLMVGAWTDYTGTITLLAAGWTSHRPPLVPVSKAGFPPKPGPDGPPRITPARSPAPH